MSITFLRSLLSNKVFLYMGSRYFTYALQFVTTLIVAYKLGPENFGIWSFILLIINFFNIVDFGISNSLNVLLVQEKENKEQCNRYVTSGLFLLSIISLLISLFFLVSRFVKFPLFSKYDIWSYLIVIILVVILAYFNKMLSVIFRVNNRLLEVALYQSIIPVLLFIGILYFNNHLLWVLLSSYLVGSILIFSLFFSRGLVHLSPNTGWHETKMVGTKGSWLFLYNSSFYLIMYVTSLFVSKNFLVEEYGKFSFAYTLSNALFLLVDSFGFIIFPKMIDKLKSTDYVQGRILISFIRKNYLTLVYFLVLLALPIFEFFSTTIPKYSDTGRALCLSGLSLLPYANAFGLNTFLIAQNREKLLSFVSTICLVLNVIILFCSRCFLIPSYDIYFLLIVVVYVLYTYLCALLSNRIMLERDFSFRNTISIAFPARLTLPLVIAFICVFLSYKYHTIILLCVPLFVYILLNIRHFKDIYKLIKDIVINPKIIDL